MTQQEVADVMNFVGKLDFNAMEVQDQALFLMALSKFAETIKPLTIKYANKLPKDVKFLMKI